MRNMNKIRRLFGRFWQRRNRDASANPHGADCCDDYIEIPDYIIEESIQMNQPPDGRLVECSHVDSMCWLVCPHESCGRRYSCSKCHDQFVPGHRLDARKVVNIVCRNCECAQMSSIMCKSCDTVFSKYYCQFCNVFDGLELDYYHCFKCRRCRTGGRDNHFHCNKCDTCLLLLEVSSHGCFTPEEIEDCCPICLSDMNDSDGLKQTVACGHALHRECFEQLQRSNCANQCPLCRRAI